jgi:hypothetical protein
LEAILEAKVEEGGFFEVLMRCGGLIFNHAWHYFFMRLGGHIE